MDLRLVPEGNRENNNICLLYYYHCWLWVYCFLLLTCLTPDPRMLDLPTPLIAKCGVCQVSSVGHGRTEEEITETKIRKIGSFPSIFSSFMKWWSFLKSCKWLAFSRLSLLVNAVALAGNSTMRPINMCPEKFLPSCGTWRTIVTDRKVFAQVRIFSLLSSAVRLFLQSCLISVLFFHKGRKSFFKDERENALGRSDWSPSFAYHCPFSFKLCLSRLRLLLLLRPPRLLEKHNERNEE